MNQLQAMRVFTRVVDVGSFSLAGKQLGISPAAVTRSINMLEAHLNMRLLNRSTRSNSLTEAGKIYLDGCRTVIEKLDELDSELFRATRDPGGQLRIAAPAAFANTELTSALAEYRLLNPRVEFEVVTYDTAIDLIEGGFDVSFTTDRHQIGANLISRPLTSVQHSLVAAPGWIRRNGAPGAPNELPEHHLLATADHPKALELVMAGASYRIHFRGPLSASHYSVVRSAAIDGMGIALLPELSIAPDIANGRLVRILENCSFNCPGAELRLVYSGRKYLSVKVRNFIDFVVERYRTNCDAQSGQLIAAAA
ncbi:MULTISPECIES: LysR family transcriptional regulator [Paraburkholderia]|uniref:LysR family transcriptional regulator n=1 Tax=Paraburkholderia TaxID=1822464 RepID=UPI002AB60B6B|nr:MULTISPECIES: LysR family transcriptional regulator [Paraburkholderia]